MALLDEILQKKTGVKPTEDKEEQKPVASGTSLLEEIRAKKPQPVTPSPVESIEPTPTPEITPTPSVSLEPAKKNVVQKISEKVKKPLQAVSDFLFRDKMYEARIAHEEEQRRQAEYQRFQIQRQQRKEPDKFTIKAPKITPEFETKFDPIKYAEDSPDVGDVDVTQPLRENLGSFISGGLSSIEGMAGAIEWAGIDSAKPVADKLKTWSDELMPEDPNFAQQVMSGFGSAAVFYVPGLGAMRATMFFSAVSPKLGMIFGNSVSTALESATEAGMVYRDLRSQGKSEKDASLKAAGTFVSNAVLIFLTNKFGIFDEGTQTAVRQGLESAVLEGGQESAQQIISNLSTGKPVLEGVKESGVIGAIVGGAMGTFANIDKESVKQALSKPPIGIPPIEPPPAGPPPAGAKVKVSEEKPKEEKQTILIGNKQVPIIREFKGVDDQTYVETKEYGVQPQSEIVAISSFLSSEDGKNLTKAIREFKTTDFAREGDIQPINAALQNVTRLIEKNTEVINKITKARLDSEIKAGRIEQNKDGTISIFRVGEPTVNELISVTTSKRAAEDLVEQKGTDTKKEQQIIELKISPNDVRVVIGGHEAELLVNRSVFKKEEKLEPLAQEARKYKSAEEFVKAQKGNVIYRATDSKSGYAELGNGIYGADTPEMAKLFGKNIEQIIIDPKAKIIKEGSPEYESLARAVTPRNDYKMNPELARKTALARGIDGIKGIDPDTGTVIFNDAVIKTKSQLTDLWNKVNKTKEEKPSKPVKKVKKVSEKKEEKAEPPISGEIKFTNKIKKFTDITLPNETGKVIIEKGKEIGIIAESSTSFLKGEKDTVHIHSLQTFGEEGSGRKIINAIFKRPGINKIEGVVTPESRGFWEKMGGQFYLESRGNKNAFRINKEDFLFINKNKLVSAEKPSKPVKKVKKVSEKKEEKPEKTDGSIPKSLIPKIVAWRKSIGELVIKTTDAWGNTFFQIRGEMPNIVQNFEVKDPSANVSIDKLAPDKLTPVEFVETAKNNIGDLIGIKGKNVPKFYIDRKYFNPVAKIHPNSKAYIKDGSSPVVFKEDDKVIALVMPLKDITGITEVTPIGEIVEPVKKEKAPAGMAAKGGQKIGGFETTKETEKVGKFDRARDVKTVSEEDVKEFKLFDKTRELINKYAERVGEDYAPRGAVGVLYPQTGNIRLNSLNNLSTASHEITHYIDVDTGLTLEVLKETDQGDDIRQELTNIYEEYYPTGKRTHALQKRITEGIAVLVQKYTEHPSVIKAKYPLLVDEFIDPDGEFYRAEIGEMLEDLKEIVAEYQGLKPLDKINSRIVTGETQIDKKKFLTPFDTIRTVLADAIFPIEKIAKVTGVWMSNNDPSLWLRQYNQYSSIFANNVIGKRGYWSFRGGDLVKLLDYNWGTLEKKLKETNSATDFNAYLIARDQFFNYQALDELQGRVDEIRKTIESAKEQGQEIKELEGTGGILLGEELSNLVEEHKNLKEVLDKNPFTREEVTEAYEQNKDRFPEEEKMFDALTRADLDLEHDPEVQLVDNDDYAIYTAKKGYASMKREIFDDIAGESETLIASTPGRTRISSLIKRRGSQKSILSPVETGIRNHQEALKKSLKQIVYNKIVQNVAPNAPEFFQKVQLEPSPDAFGRITYPQEKDPQIIMGRINYKRVPVLVDNYIKTVIDDVLTYQNVTVFEKVASVISRTFTRSTTAGYILFAPVNVLLDQPSAIINTKNNYIPLLDSVKVLSKALLKKDTPENRYYLEYLVSGGMQQTMAGAHDMTNEELRDSIIKEKEGIAKVGEMVDKGVDILSIPSQASEIHTRAIEYIKARKSGKPFVVAREEAGRVTAPFHHFGSWKLNPNQRSAKAYIKMIAFFNAGIQVMDQLARTAQESEEGRKRIGFTLAAVTAAVLTSTALIFGLGDRDDEEQYLSLPPEELAGYLWFPNPFGKGLIKIRVSETLSGLPYMLNMMILTASQKTYYKPLDYLDVATAGVPDQFNPTDFIPFLLSWFPTPLKTTSEFIFEKKTFPEVRDIVPQGLQRLPDELQYNDYTANYAIYLGKLLNVSPMKIEHLVTGFVGRSVKQIIAPGTIPNPFLKDYYFQGGRALQQYYDIKQETEADRNAMTKRLKEFSPKEKRLINKRNALIKQVEKLLDQYDTATEQENEVRMRILRNQILDKIQTINSAN